MVANPVNLKSTASAELAPSDASTQPHIADVRRRSFPISSPSTSSSSILFQSGKAVAIFDRAIDRSCALRLRRQRFQCRVEIEVFQRAPDLSVSLHGQAAPQLFSASFPQLLGSNVAVAQQAPQLVHPFGKG